MYTYKKAREAYINDPIFHRLVDTLKDSIVSLDLSPADLRAAVIFACILHEEEKPISLVLSREEANKLGIRIEED